MGKLETTVTAVRDYLANRFSLSVPALNSFPAAVFAAKRRKMRLQVNIDTDSADLFAALADSSPLRLSCI